MKSLLFKRFIRMVFNISVVTVIITIPFLFVNGLNPVEWAYGWKVAFCICDLAATLITMGVFWYSSLSDDDKENLNKSFKTSLDGAFNDD